MSRNVTSFSDLLLKRPLLFTVVPLRDNLTGDPKHDDKILKNVSLRKSDMVSSLHSITRLNAVNVPELVEENHEGKPRYNSVYTRMLAKSIASALGIDAIVNKVVVHLPGYGEFMNWLKETTENGIRNIIIVGGNTRHHRYPGPSVAEANITVQNYLRIHKENPVTIGNICLPERRDEAMKMLYKTISGAQFFTTQMLFDHRQIIQVLSEYGSLCQEAGIKPATVLLSFAPLKSTADLNLLDFLGVDLPERVKESILEGGSIDATAHRSLMNALSVYKEIIVSLEKKKVDVPLGVNIEQLTKSNLPLSVNMLDTFARIIDMNSDEVSDHYNKFSEDN
jgi:5,10-methylenetetrahydrofolate reductase